MTTMVSLNDFTTAKVDGTGVFDVLMQAMKEHLDIEFQKNRIRGTEYSTVYLGSLDSVMKTALEFLLQRQRVALEAELMAQQVLVAQAEVEKARAQAEVARQEVEKIKVELDILNLNKEKIPVEIAVLRAQECKLKAEYDVLLAQVTKTTAETTLLDQKTVTERAQVTAMGVDEDSVIGKQKTLYGAQAAGFQRDAEQKAAKLMIDVWSVQRSTDEAIKPTEEARITDPYIGRAVNKLLTGINA